MIECEGNEISSSCLGYFSIFNFSHKSINERKFLLSGPPLTHVPLLLTYFSKEVGVDTQVLSNLWGGGRISGGIFCLTQLKLRSPQTILEFSLGGGGRLITTSSDYREYQQQQRFMGGRSFAYVCLQQLRIQRSLLTPLRSCHCKLMAGPILTPLRSCHCKLMAGPNTSPSN